MAVPTELAPVVVIPPSALTVVPEEQEEFGPLTQFFMLLAEVVAAIDQGLLLAHLLYLLQAMAALRDPAPAAVGQAAQVAHMAHLVQQQRPVQPISAVAVAVRAIVRTPALLQPQEVELEVMVDQGWP